MHIAPLLMMLIAAPLAATAQDQDDRAAQIMDMSDAQSSDRSANAPSRLHLDDCALTSISFNPNVFLGTMDAIVLQTSLTQATLRPIIDGQLGELINDGTILNLGLITFDLPQGTESALKRDISTDMTTQALLDHPATSRQPAERWTHALHNTPSQDHIEALAAAILAYKRDFCSLTS